MIGPYRALVRRSDPRQFPCGLLAYARLEYGEADPQWLLNDGASASAGDERSEPCETQGPRLITRLRAAVASFFF